MARLRIRRGTKVQLDTAAAGSTLSEGELGLVTDEKKLVVATSQSAYVTFFPTVQLTASQYAALDPKDSNTLYLIVG